MGGAHSRAREDDMTRDEMQALPKGARVVVVKSGKVYQVTYPARPGVDELPDFRQWRTGEAAHPGGRLYGPAFVRLKPENVVDQAFPVVAHDLPAQLSAARGNDYDTHVEVCEPFGVQVPGLPRPLPADMVSDVALHTPRPFDPTRGGGK
jgi:hypothetical protein